MVGVAALVAAVAPATGAAPVKHFAAYPSCGAAGKHGARFCFAGERPVAVFRAFGRAGLAYRVCAHRRGGPKRCADRRTDDPGERSRTRLAMNDAGRYNLAWFAGGRDLDRDRLVVRERSALIVGDSLSEGTRPYLPRALGSWHLDQSVSTSRHSPQGVSILRRRNHLPGAVIFALGTNDDPHDVDGFRSSLDAVRAIAGPTRCVVVPNIVRPPVGGAGYSGYNRVIAELAHHHSNFRLVDWAELVARNRGWLAEDGAHVTAQGYEARARAIARQVERC
jgi:lysophospholipase L1-like esterase